MTRQAATAQPLVSGPSHLRLPRGVAPLPVVQLQPVIEKSVTEKQDG